MKDNYIITRTGYITEGKVKKDPSLQNASKYQQLEKSQSASVKLETLCMS